MNTKIDLMNIKLNENEKAVFKEIQTYLKKNRSFKIQKIIPFLQYNIDRSLNLNSDKIEIILQSLIKKNMVYPGSYLTVDDILKNQKRKDFFNFIEKNPGVKFSVIKNEFSFGNNYTDWHLTVLERFKFIRFVKIGNNKAFFNFNLDSKFDETRFYLKNKKMIQIITLMEKSKKALKISEMSNQLKMHNDTLKKYITILEKLNFLDLKLENDKSSYMLNFDNYNTILKDIEI